MMKIALAESFSKDFQKLPEITRSARVDWRYRISFEFTGNDTILLRRIRDHDDLYLTP
jgi:mRNA-degrading endonuclease RelE of RelBE toxin-antitoxin system